MTATELNTTHHQYIISCTYIYASQQLTVLQQFTSNKMEDNFANLMSDQSHIINPKCIDIDWNFANCLSCIRMQ